jgi:hypothetical protein
LEEKMFSKEELKSFRNPYSGSSLYLYRWTVEMKAKASICISEDDTGGIFRNCKRKNPDHD